MFEWIRVGKSENSEGTTITYQAKGEPWLRIQSHKRHIPHANGIGTWDHTSYWVVSAGVSERECYSLKDAKNYCEQVYGTEVTA